jgi:ATP-binding cassette subfamily B (MDR/TAP) protein 9
MGFILRMMGPDWCLLLWAYFSLVLAALGESLVPYLYGQVIDAIAIQPDMERFRNFMLLLIGTALSTGIFTGFRGSTFIVIGGRFGKRLRMRLFEALLRQELDFFGATKTGDVTSRLSADCQKVSDQVQLNVNVFLRSLIQAVFTFGFMVYLNSRLALACFVTVPAIVIASDIFASYMRVLSKASQDALAKANAHAEETISSISTVRAFAAERDENRRYEDGMSEYLGTIYSQAKVYYFYSSITFTFLPYLTYCIILFFAAQLIHTPEGCVMPGSPPPAGNCSVYLPPPPPQLPGTPPPPTCGISGANLISFVFYMDSLFSAFKQLCSIFTSLAQAVGAADSVVRWIRRTPTVQPPQQPLVPTGCRGDLKLIDVRFRYALRPERPILSGLSLHAAPGEVVALCGPSGGGKSTVVALLERFYVPESGRVLLDDVDIALLEPGWFHRRVALVGQEPTLFARSLRDNILYGLADVEPSAKPEEEDVVRACRLANAHDFVAGFEHGYDTFVGERGTQLSGGQKQRIAIARAIVRTPAVLLLDEATSALDAESEHIVQSAIDAMIEQSSMTVVVIAHRLSTVRNADRILVIRDGVVAEGGTHVELLAKPDGIYAKLVQRQMQSSSAGGSGLASAHASRHGSSANLSAIGSGLLPPSIVQVVPQGPPPALAGGGGGGGGEMGQGAAGSLAGPLRRASTSPGRGVQAEAPSGAASSQGEEPQKGHAEGEAD